MKMARKAESAEMSRMANHKHYEALELEATCA